MARKDSVADWDVTPNNNDNVGGVNIAENCAAANLNNAIRTVMSQIKTYSLGAQPNVGYVTKNSNYTALVTDKNAFFRFTSSATLYLDDAATLTSGWCCWIMADGGSVTIDPDGSETVNGALTLTIDDGFSAFVLCSGTTFYALTLTPQDIADMKLDAAQPYISVASAATTDIGAEESQNLTITGTTTITSFGTVAAGTVRNIVFSGALTLTHNATSLILPFGANITTAAGTAIRAVSLGSGNWRVTDYQEVAQPAVAAGSGISIAGSLAAGTATISLDLYTGNSASQTSFPVGWSIVVYTNGTAVARNGAISPAINSVNSGSYVLSSNPDAGSTLSGTWRAQGGFGSGFTDFYKAMRVA